MRAATPCIIHVLVPRFLEATMKKILLLCAGLATLWAPVTYAGLDLSWNSCPPDGLVPNITPDCAAGGTHYLVGSFQSPVAMGGFAAMDIYIDLQVEGADLTPFWHFEVAGCNPAGLEFSSDRTALGASCTLDTPWTLANDADIISYGAGLNGANRARILCSVTLSGGRPILATHDYYAFHLGFRTAEASEGGGNCAGCSDKVAFVWNQADLYNDGSGPGFLSVIDPGSLGNCVGWNGPSAGLCATTPTLNRTWGAIKAQYR